MARKNDVFGVSGTDTVIGSTVKLKGNLSSDTDITIDGKLAGNIKSGGHVTLGVNAEVTGNVTATSATIGGRLNGDIKVVDSTSITESGQVYGDIATARLEIEMGAVFIGDSKMKPIEATVIADRTEADQASKS